MQTLRPSSKIPSPLQSKVFLTWRAQLTEKKSKKEKKKSLPQVYSGGEGCGHMSGDGYKPLDSRVGAVDPNKQKLDWKLFSPVVFAPGKHLFVCNLSL
jgi:hypothetical protein